MADPRGSIPWTQDELDRLRTLHAAGKSRNDIAREMGRSGASVSKYAEQLGLSFDRSGVQAATEARKADAKAKRSRLELLLLEEAERCVLEMRQAITYVDHGGKDMVRVEWDQDSPTAADKRQLMQAAGTAIDRSLRIADHDSDQGVDAAKSLLGALALKLGIAQPAPPDAG